MEIPITPLRAQYVVCELPSWRFFNAHTAVPQNGHCPRWASRISLALARASRTTATSPAAGSPNAEASALRPSLVKPQRCFNRYPAKKLANSQRACSDCTSACEAAILWASVDFALAFSMEVRRHPRQRFSAHDQHSRSYVHARADRSARDGDLLATFLRHSPTGGAAAPWWPAASQLVAAHWNYPRLVRVFRRLHPCAKFRAIFGSIEKQPMSRPFFFIFPAGSDHIIKGNNGERLGRAVTTGIETHKVVVIIDNGLNAPVPMRKRGDEVFTNEQLES